MTQVKPTQTNGTTEKLVVADEVRREVSGVVFDNIERARKVLAGQEHWNAHQVSLFKAMLSKVVPDVSSSVQRKEIVTRKADDMSREEMERYIAERIGK